ncbi:1590_t:CDS:2, partial [Gigaspora rosea]
MTVLIESLIDYYGDHRNLEASCTASTTRYTTVNKIKRRQGQNVTITNKENAPLTGGAADPKLRPKRAVKAVHRAGMNPTPLQQQPQNYQHQQTQVDPKRNYARKWSKRLTPVNTSPDQPPEHRKCTIDQPETSSNMNVQEPHMQDLVIPQTASISMHSLQYPEPDGNRVEESKTWKTWNYASVHHPQSEAAQ